jgi:hypothetical protein
MRDALAEALLARVMDWDEADVAAQRPILQGLADYKYDSYERYQAGMRFFESLACWLSQFERGEARQRAYRLVRERLIFISRAELEHLVASSYPDHIRPWLLGRAAEDLGISAHLVEKVRTDQAFRVRQRSCLFVGLSDGARTDVLRRSNPIISNEQVVADYHGLASRGEELLKDLRADLGSDGVEEAATARFTTLVLLDDFSASGISYLRSEEGERKGKIAKIAREIEDSELLDPADLQVRILLYVGTDKAIEYLRGELVELEDSAPGTWSLERVQGLGPEEITRKGDDPELDALIEQVYDPAIYDKHMEKGGADGRYGFADCGLSVVLSHNAPNNSLAILWADTGAVTGLFPRVTRHRESF